MKFLLLLISVPLLLGAYLGWRCRWAFGAQMPSWLAAHYVYWPLVLLIVMSFPLAHFMGRIFGVAVPPWLLLATAILLGTLAMSFTTVLITDIVAMIARRLPFLASLCQYFRLHPAHLGLLVLAAIALQVAHGLYHAHTPRETHYTLAIDKPLANGATQLRVVQVSDMHISRFTSPAHIQAMVEQVNALSPDLVVFTGDLVDNSVQPFLDKGMPQILAKLNSRYGAYAILGNHEYYGESPDRDVAAYTSAGLRVLRDETLYLDTPGITLIGRDDWIRGSAQLPLGSAPPTATGRATLANLVAQANPATPWLLLDHQPHAVSIDEAAAQKIDVQFSGHTHNGQFFPFNLITRAMYPESWGLLGRGAYRLIVSCGFGTWGPPMRMPSYAEIVVADLKFNPKS